MVGPKVLLEVFVRTQLDESSGLDQQDSCLLACQTPEGVLPTFAPGSVRLALPHLVLMPERVHDLARLLEQQGEAFLKHRNAEGRVVGQRLGFRKHLVDVVLEPDDVVGRLGLLGHLSHDAPYT